METHTKEPQTVARPGRRPATRSAAVGLTAAALITSLAACGGSDSGAASSGTAAPSSNAAGGTSGLAAIKAEVDKARQPSGAFVAPGPSVDAATLKGKELWFIPVASAVPVLGVEAQGVKDAAGQLGMRYKTCDGKFVPASASSCIKQAVNANAGGIVIDAIDPKTVAPAVAAAEAKRIPIVGATGGGEPSPYYQPVSMGDAESQPVAANWIVADSEGKADVLAVSVVGNAETENAAKAGVTQLAKICPSCKRTEVAVTAPQSQTIPSAVSSALLKNPSVTYGLPQFDFLAPLFQRGVQQAGRNGKVKVLSTNGVLPQMKLVKSGSGQVADVGANRNYAGWLAVDALVRMAADAPPATKLEIPVRVFDKTNVGDITLTDEASKSGEWYGPTDYKDGFVKLWGVS